MIGPARLAALETLRAVHAHGTALPDALEAARRALDDPRDVGLATEIAVGTLRWRATLDYMLSQLTSRPLDRLDAGVLDVLRVSTYQLLHLERVPASAVVHDAVELARHGGHAAAAGLVNAVLRRVANPRTRPPLPARPATGSGHDAWVTHLAVTWSHPAWLVDRWLAGLGTEATEARLRHHQQTAHPVLRVNALVSTPEALAARLRADGVETEPSRYLPGALLVRSGNPLRSEAMREGTCLVQDEGSQLVAAYVAAAAGQRVLDVCAAPGGKASAMAEGVGPTGLVVAGDLRPRRTRLLRQTARTLGVRLAVVRHDGQRGLPFADVFDQVVVDAPCSGLGTLRRDPDLKWRRRVDELPRFAATQLRLLAEAARAVRAGGHLVYATCSSEPEENDQVVAAFLDAHEDFTSSPPAGPWAAEPLAALLDPDGRLRTLPERDGLDAFFAARFARLG